MVEQIIKQLTEQRKRLDAIGIGYTFISDSRSKSISFTALETSRMYIGEVCRELGGKYPYEATKTATTPQEIKEAVDKADSNIPSFKDKGNEITNLNDLRELLEKELNVFIDIVFNNVTNINSLYRTTKGSKSFIMNCNISAVYRNLKETRMYLGIRLGEIKSNDLHKS